MKKITIPTNSGNSAVNLFKLVSKLFPQERIHCRFVQILAVPDDYIDLLTLARSPVTCTPFDAGFAETMTDIAACQNYRLSFETDQIYGDSPAVFRNYMQYHASEMVIYDRKDWQESRTKQQLDIFRMVSRSGCEIIFVADGQSRALETLPGSHSGYPALEHTRAVPAGISHQYQIVNERLDANEGTRNKTIISRKFSNLSRYFLNENILQQVLNQANSSLLLVRK